MLLYTDFFDFSDASKQPQERSSEPDLTQPNSTRKSSQALTKQFHQLQTNYSLERRLFW
jgi:hypothetical protein